MTFYGLIYDYDKKNNVLKMINKNKMFYFSLDNKIYDIFKNSLSKNILVSFNISNKIKYENYLKMYVINGFNYIIQLRPHRVFYDYSMFRKWIRGIYNKRNNLLFLDFEMTMNYYNMPLKYRDEIIQFGGILTDYKGLVIEEKNYYVRPLKKYAINKRTLNFLNIDKNNFFQTARPFSIFYEDLKRIYFKYKPIIVTWTKNDYFAFNNECQAFGFKTFLKESDFLDLSIIQKNYLNLYYQPGLFRTHDMYFKKQLSKQEHNAYIDCKVLKEIYFKFIETINKKGRKNGI